ncbi:MAG: ABC transporter substrate-binding protein [Syntrophorhabdales bacterium]|jgi:NitT/TauT family transport system substrate-binding protein
MKKIGILKVVLVLGIGLILAFFTAGSGLAKELLPMKVSYIPIMDCQQLYVAWDKGYFEEEGLKVEGQVAQGGAVSQTLVESGSVELGWTAVVPLSQAYLKGFDFTFIAAGAFFGSANPKAAGILVKKDSPIQSVKDLAGKKIAVNALQSVNHLAVLAIADFYGVDIKTLKFVEIPMPSQAPALKEGAVDACHNVQPFIAASEAEGITRLLYGGFYPPEIADREMISSWFAKKSSLEKNKDKMTRFLKAITKATDFINKNPDQMNAIVAKYTKLDVNLLNKVTQPKFYTKINKKDIQVSIDLCAKYGFIKNGFDAKEIVATSLVPLQ